MNGYTLEYECVGIVNSIFHFYSCFRAQTDGTFKERVKPKLSESELKEKREERTNNKKKYCESE